MNIMNVVYELGFCVCLQRIWTRKSLYCSETAIKDAMFFLKAFSMRFQTNGYLPVASKHDCHSTSTKLYRSVAETNVCERLSHGCSWMRVQLATEPAISRSQVQ